MDVVCLLGRLVGNHRNEHWRQDRVWFIRHYSSFSACCTNKLVHDNLLLFNLPQENIYTSTTEEADDFVAKRGKVEFVVGDVMSDRWE